MLPPATPGAQYHHAVRADFVVASTVESFNQTAFRLRLPEQNRAQSAVSISIDNVDDQITAAINAIQTPANLTFERVFAPAVRVTVALSTGYRHIAD